MYYKHSPQPESAEIIPLESQGVDLDMLFKAKLHEESKNGFKTINFSSIYSWKTAITHEYQSWITIKIATFDLLYTNSNFALVLFMKINLSKLGYIVKIAQMFKYCPKESK